jgi:hypothetical protein
VVLELPVPDVDSYDRRGRRVRNLGRRDGGVWIQTSQLDPVAQLASFEVTMLSPDGGVRVQPVHHRYVWPTELDLMAELGGLRLAGRYADWSGAPFGAAAESYVVEYVAAPDR